MKKWGAGHCPLPSCGKTWRCALLLRTDSQTLPGQGIITSALSLSVVSPGVTQTEAWRRGSAASTCGEGTEHPSSCGHPLESPASLGPE